MPQITPCDSAEKLAAVKDLFVEYQQRLNVDLCFQSFNEELASLPGAYAPPGGRLLLAVDDGSYVGCAAFRPLGDEDCEMKRLFVQPHLRGQGIGRMLVKELIAEAQSVGYRKMCLDTLVTMTIALSLYRSFGFVEVPAYCLNPLPGTRYMCLNLGLAPGSPMPR